MVENVEYIDEFFLVHLVVVNKMDDKKLHHKLKNLYPMDLVVMEA